MKNSEQLVGLPQVTEVEDKECEERQANLTGKFKDVLSLLKAYNKLEAEFTRRSQRLKQLELLVEELKAKQQENNLSSQVTASDDIAELNPDIETEQTQSKTVLVVEPTLLEGENISKTTTEATHGNQGGTVVDDNILRIVNKIDELEQKLNSKAFLINLIEQDKELSEKIIRDYLKNIRSSKPQAVLIKNDGTSVVTPPYKPKSMQEAGNLAKMFIKKS